MEPRRVLLAALRQAARHQPELLARGLKFPSSVSTAALSADAGASRTPTMAALDRYIGVLYQGLAAGDLTPAARRRAEQDVLVFSGLWGVVRGGDLVPDYRVPASGSVPGLGGVTKHWRGPLASALPELVGNAPVLDLRSGDYLGLWRPGPDLRRQVLTVRVLAAREAGGRRLVAPVSYHAKLVKGQVARHVLMSRRTFVQATSAVEDAASALGLDVVDTARSGAPSVDVIGTYP